MFSPLTYAYWGVNTALKLVLIVLCWRSDYKAFRSYLVTTFAKAALLWVCAIHGSVGAYFWAYYGGQAVETVMLLMAIVELAALLFYPLEIVPKDIFLRGVCVLTVLVFLMWTGAAMFHSHSPITRYAVARTVDLIETGTLLALLATVIAVSRYLRIPWRKRAIWVASGLTFYLTIELAYSTRALNRALPGLETVHSNAFLIAGLIWVVGFIAKETEMEIPSIEVLRKAVEIANQIDLESIPRKRCASVRPKSPILRPTSVNKGVRGY